MKAAPLWSAAINRPPTDLVQRGLADQHSTRVLQRLHRRHGGSGHAPAGMGERAAGVGRRQLGAPISKPRHQASMPSRRPLSSVPRTRQFMLLPRSAPFCSAHQSAMKPVPAVVGYGSASKQSFTAQRSRAEPLGSEWLLPRQRAADRACIAAAAPADTPKPYCPRSAIHLLPAPAKGTPSRGDSGRPERQRWLEASAACRTSSGS